MSEVKRYFALVDDTTKEVEDVVRSDVGPDVLAQFPGKTWMETSKDRAGGKPYAGKGYVYVDRLGAFVPGKPYKAWILDEVKYKWKAPVEAPKDGKKYKWDDATDSWVEDKK